MSIDTQDTISSDPRGTSGTRVFFLLFEQLSFGDTRTRSKIGVTPNAKAETRAYGMKKNGKVAGIPRKMLRISQKFSWFGKYYRSCGRVAAIFSKCRLQ